MISNIRIKEKIRNLCFVLRNIKLFWGDMVLLKLFKVFLVISK